jgi:DNA polymerase II
MTKKTTSTRTPGDDPCILKAMEGNTVSKLRGFIVHPFFRTIRGGTQICLVGRSEDGETFAVIDDRFRSSWGVRVSEGGSCRSVLRHEIATRRCSISESEFTTMDGEACLLVEWGTEADSSRGAAALTDRGIRTYEADIRPYERFLSDRHIRGSVTVEGAWSPGNHVDKVFINPVCTATEWHPRISVLSIDIETAPFGSEIQAIGCDLRDPWTGVERREILFVSESPADRDIHCVPDEPSLLREFVRLVREADPDIITGWNVIEFDFLRIAERCAVHGVPMDFARSDEGARFLAGDGRTSSAMIIPGRQVLDGIRLVRASPERFEDYSLETVAQGVLGTGKEIDAVGSREKLAELKRLHDTDPVAFCRYCLNDAVLVVDILERTGLLELTIMRCLLIGVPLGRAWTSIASFEHIYMEALHDRRIFAPTRGVDPLPGGRAPGGAIITPRSGVFDNVLVFDFKSLYPSIIRTFNIDPLGYLGGGEYADNTGDAITAPNGARFAREPGILPEMLGVFFGERQAAKDRGDETASYVYKIVMNSFYGVLGARGCRFAGAPLAGAITSFGQRLLHWCRDVFSEQGYRVLYGDTDSLFVESGLPPGVSYTELSGLGHSLSGLVNRRLSQWVYTEYAVKSSLDLEFEKTYRSFFIPPMRSDITLGRPAGEFDEVAEGIAVDTTLRGRAKGYAGLAVHGDDDPGQIEIKGMEAVRSDWTMAAREFQRGLLDRIFRGGDGATIEEFIRDTVMGLRSGRLDEKLVYRKGLRKGVSEYTKSMPPHVKAASFLPEEDQKGTVRYLITRSGPQPVGFVSAEPDYEHYLTKQLRPIAEAFGDIVPIDIPRLFSVDHQLNLF